MSRAHELVGMIDWYRRCLEDMVDGRPVRGLAEAKAGYDRAIAEVERLAADAERYRQALKFYRDSADRDDGGLHAIEALTEASE